MRLFSQHLTRRVDTRPMMNMVPSFALVLPGDAMWGAFQTGFAIQMAQQLEAAGFGSQPFDLTVGSSSGSLVATVAAAGTDVTHPIAHDTWIQFALATSRKRVLGRRWLTGNLTMPHREALTEIFDRGLIDIDGAYQSRTTVVVSASRFDKLRALDSIRSAHSLLRQGLKSFLSDPEENATEQLSEQLIELLAAGADIFTPRYFSSKPWNPALTDALPDQWRVLDDPSQLRSAVEASACIPLIYGQPMEMGGELLIDGVFADNAPLELALLYGATHIFVVSSSRKGNVFPRPVQSMARRGLYRSLQHTNKLAYILELIPRSRRITLPLRHIATLQESVPRPAPLDLDELRQQYPSQHIYVISPNGAPPVNRFFESRPSILSSLYETGQRAARELESVIPPSA